uniref:tyrosine--tRNA ligase n=1 Tax=Biomphalaria glabrata TaxID=6526 RepID=A0A2C9KTD5_BIOGL
MSILNELKERGIFNNITSEEKFNKLPENVGVYIGFDPTAESLHLGNYIQISILKRFKSAGFKAIAVLGGATGMIGDPSGRSSERNLLDQKTLLNNKAKIKAQLESYGLEVVDNLDFYKDMNVLDFLREVGKLANVNHMIQKDVVKSRLDAENIESIVSEHKSNLQSRSGQKALAYEVVKDVHSLEDAEDALKLSNVLFGSGDIKTLSPNQVLQFDGSVPTFMNLTGSLKDVLISIGAANSNREVREFLSTGTIEVNGEKIMDENFLVSPGFD